MSVHPIPVAVASCGGAMAAALDVLADAVAKGGKILVCGNGGSAADAEHMVGELMKGFYLSRPLSVEQVAGLERAAPGEGEILARGLQQGIPAVSLVSPVGLITAIANDTDPCMIFAQQVVGLGRPGDVLVALSTSGNSRNVVAAAKVARAFGLTVLALTGRGGGALAPLAHVAIQVPADSVAAIQELHLPVYHWLCAELEEMFFGDRAEKSLPIRGHADGHLLAELPATIGLVVFDFDGVFTDNRVYTAQDGSESVACDRGDGLGIDMMRRHGVPMMILSTETNKVVSARGNKLRLPVEQSCGDKAAWLAAYLAEQGIDPATVVYLGNDVNDLAAMDLSGFSVAPADAHPQVLAAVDLVLTRDGGRGAVRELCELILSRKAKV